MKKQTKKQKPINIPSPSPEPVSITDNTFTGVHWDAEAIEAVTLTARALLNLTELFKSQNIEIKSMISVETNRSGVEGHAVGSTLNGEALKDVADEP